MTLEEALDEFKIEYHKSGDDSEISICCPFCLEEGESEDTRFRLGINTQTGQAQCFNCGKKSGGGDYIFNELQRIWESGDLENDHRKKTKKKKTKRPVLPEDFQIVSPKNKDHWNRKAYEYLRSRGVTKRQIKEKKIGYCVVDGHFHHRIVFPIYWKDKLQGLVGRDFTLKQSPPYKNSVGSKTLCNLPETPRKSIVLVEGLFDSLGVERSIRKEDLEMDSAATLGHTLTGRQLKQLRKYKTIILWYDPDEAGIEGLLHDRKQIKELYPRKKLKFIVPLTYYNKDDSDPSDLSHRQRVKRLGRAKLFTDSWVSRLKAMRAFEE